MHIIENVLESAEATAVQSFLGASEDAFDSGDDTAGWHAGAVKHNEQMREELAAAICEKVRDALLANDSFRTLARPSRFAKTMLSRYRQGMEYGLHVDDAFIGGERTDLSFTLFLSAPQTYDGGELIIESDDGESAVKLEAGSCIVYPSTTLHRVAPVTRGERLAVVGWVRSLVRDAGEREILTDLDQAIAEARTAGASHGFLARLLKVKMNLLRKWAD